MTRMPVREGSATVQEFTAYDPFRSVQVKVEYVICGETGKVIEARHSWNGAYWHVDEDFPPKVSDHAWNLLKRLEEPFEASKALLLR